MKNILYISVIFILIFACRKEELLKPVVNEIEKIGLTDFDLSKSEVIRYVQIGKPVQYGMYRNSKNTYIIYKQDFLADLRWYGEQQSEMAGLKYIQLPNDASFFKIEINAQKGGSILTKSDNEIEVTYTVSSKLICLKAKAQGSHVVQGTLYYTK